MNLRNAKKIFLFWMAGSIFIPLVVGAAFCVAQDVEKGLDAILKQQKVALKHELERMEFELGLDRKHFEAIKNEVDEVLESGAENLLKGFNMSDQVSARSYSGILSRALANATHSAAKDFVDAELYAEYRADYEKVLEWEDRYSQKNVIVFLDTFLQLSASQVEALETRLAENWNYTWNYLVIQSPFNGYEACKDVLNALESHETKPNQITELLTPVQRKIFDDLAKLGGNYKRVLALAVDEELELMKEDLQHFQNRSIEYLSEKVELNEKQLVRLRVGFKGAWRKVSVVRENYKIAYRAKPGLWEMAGLMETPFQQMRMEKLWQRAVLGLLPVEVRQAIEEEEAQRQQRRLEIAPVFGITYLQKVRRLKFKEIVALYELTQKHVVKINESNIYRTTFVLYSLSDTELQENLDEEAFEKLKLRIESARFWKRPDEDEIENED